MKFCPKCKEYKDTIKFGNDKSRKDKLACWCKDCDSKKGKQTRLKNKENNLALGERVFVIGKLKYCSKCKLEKEESYFSLCISTLDGLQNTCKECDGILHNEWNLRNPTKVQEGWERWAANNPEKAAEARSIWYEENKERLSSVRSAHYFANKDAYSTRNRNKRARKKAAGGILSPGLQKKLFELQRGCCAICKKKLSNNTKYQHMDHIIPVTPRPGDKQGTNTDENMQLLCQLCNNRKHNKDPIDYMQSLGYLL